MSSAYPPEPDHASQADAGEITSESQRDGWRTHRKTGSKVPLLASWRRDRASPLEDDSEARAFVQKNADEANPVDGDSEPKTFVQKNAGLLLVVLSMLCFSAINALVAYLGRSSAAISTSELILLRMGITYVCSVAMMRTMGIADPYWGPPEMRLLLGTVGLGGIGGLYFSLQYLSVSEASVLSFLGPFFAGLFAWIFLRERYRLVEFLSGLISFVGVLLVAKPSAIFGLGVVTGGIPKSDGTPVTEAERLTAVLIGLSGSVCAGLAYTSIRAIGHRTHALHSLAYFSLCSVIFSLALHFIWPVAQPFKIPDHGMTISLLLGIGLIGFVAQLLLTTGLQLEKASRASLMVYITLPCAMVFDKLVFSTTMDALSLLGAAIIMGSAVWVALNKPTQTAATQSEQMDRLPLVAEAERQAQEDDTRDSLDLASPTKDSSSPV